MTRKSLLGIAIGILLANQALAAPTTSTFMNAVAACGAGSSVSIDAKLQGSMQSLYEQKSTEGRATQTILVEIAKLLPQGKVYELYLDCLKTLVKD